MTLRTWAALLTVAVVVMIASVAYPTNPAVVLSSTGGYERTTLTIVDDETGETLAIVNARAADTRARRFTGLSGTGSLAENGGMRFIRDSSDTYTYVMHDMNFPLGIAFVAENGTIARIHHVELNPERTSESDLTHHRGIKKYVLEFPYGYTNKTGIGADDRVEVE